MEVGTIKRGLDLGFKYNHKYMWVKCPNCGKERWIIASRNRLDLLCHPCMLKNNKPWEYINRRHPEKVTCLDCGKQIRASKSGYCRGCRYHHPEFNPGWKGGKTKDGEGHILVKVETRGNGHNGYEPEHRIIWVKLHGKLPKGYVIHHLNGIPDDNRIENLAALPIKKHNVILRTYKRRIKQLEIIIRELKSQRNYI